MGNWLESKNFFAGVTRLVTAPVRLAAAPVAQAVGLKSLASDISAGLYSKNSLKSWGEVYQGAGAAAGLYFAGVGLAASGSAKVAAAPAAKTATTEAAKSGLLATLAKGTAAAVTSFKSFTQLFAQPTPPVSVASPSIQPQAAEGSYTGPAALEPNNPKLIGDLATDSGAMLAGFSPVLLIAALGVAVFLFRKK